MVAISLIIFKITLGLLVLTLALFTINSLKKTSAYKSDKYDYCLLTLLTFELVLKKYSYFFNTYKKSIYPKWIYAFLLFLPYTFHFYVFNAFTYNVTCHN
ncbi:hypothetical protein GBN91_03180 [Bacillus sp. B1-WWTP-T-0.5-Post-4]|nr:hypothetical protein GBN91_03180 [Bacillus sp. B1-WWTP-T-0.5-Post-4]